MTSLFFSYSHKDEDLRDQLEAHLSPLKRDGLITVWHDRHITPGSNLRSVIDKYLDEADVILILVSPDFLNSDFCYDRELDRALQRHAAGQARVIPIILRPCDWQDLPFGKLLAAPRDGKAITLWPNIDDAFLDVVKSIKNALNEHGPKRQPAAPSLQEVWRSKAIEPVETEIRLSNLRINKEFTEGDIDLFRHEAFEYLAKFFKNSLQELVARHPGTEYDFHHSDSNWFSAAVYRDGAKVGTGCLTFDRGWGSSGINFHVTETPTDRPQETLYAESDDQTLYFELASFQDFGPGHNVRLSQQDAAEHFWRLFVKPLLRRLEGI